MAPRVFSDRKEPYDLKLIQSWDHISSSSLCYPEKLSWLCIWTLVVSILPSPYLSFILNCTPPTHTETDVYQGCRNLFCDTCSWNFDMISEERYLLTQVSNWIFLTQSLGPRFHWRVFVLLILFYPISICNCFEGTKVQVEFVKLC